MTIRTTKRVETLLSNKKINTETNDYKAYGRTFPGSNFPAPLFGQQYKFGKAEAVKLSKSIVSPTSRPRRSGCSRRSTRAPAPTRCPRAPWR